MKRSHFKLFQSRSPRKKTLNWSQLKVHQLPQMKLKHKILGFKYKLALMRVSLAMGKVTATGKATTMGINVTKTSIKLTSMGINVTKTSIKVILMGINVRKSIKVISMATKATMMGISVKLVGITYAKTSQTSLRIIWGLNIVMFNFKRLKFAISFLIKQKKLPNYITSFK